jgi:hypothetical protein
MTLLDQVEILFTKFPGVQKMEKKPKFWFMRVGLKIARRRRRKRRRRGGLLGARL